jgi:lipoprotein-anchoring transpeptidase ErfK/SrfK
VEGKQIVVDLSKQQVYAYQDGELLKTFVVSSGLPAYPTVVGDFSIYLRYTAQRMIGPGYDLPGVPWVMYFYQGYGLHGTYWHNNFGHPMSHGCVNMKTDEAKWLYDWAPNGTPVHVQY